MDLFYRTNGSLLPDTWLFFTGVYREGDFFNENEEITEKALSKLNEIYVKEIIEYFNEKNISLAGIERAVGLPQRTLTKWKNNFSSPSAAGVALLKYLRTFPWLLEVAEQKFNYDIAQKIFLEAAFNTFVNSIHFKSSGIVPPADIPINNK